MSYEEFRERDARLLILVELAKENDGRLTEAMLVSMLDVNGYRRSADWLRTQLRKLEELRAVKLTEIGERFVISLTTHGLDHVERRAVIEGVARPSRAN